MILVGFKYCYNVIGCTQNVPLQELSKLF